MRDLPNSSPSERPRHDLRLVGPALGAWVAAWVVTGELGDQGMAGLSVAGLGVGAAACLAVLVGARARVWRVAIIGVAALGSLMTAQLAVSLVRDGPVAQAAANGAIAEVQAVVTSDPRIVESHGQTTALVPVSVRLLVVHGTAHRLRTPASLTVGADQLQDLQVEVGATLSSVVVVQPPQPGEGRAARLRVRGEPRLVELPGPFDRAINHLRAGLRTAMANSPDEARGLVPALVVGDVSALPEDVVDDFKATGLTHLSAVSGTNLVLLLAFVLPVAKRLRVRGIGLNIASVLVVGCFVVLCRSEPSVLRAAAMGLVAMAATGVAGRGSGLRNLALAVLVLVWVDPWLSRSWGFALSVAASAGILTLGAAWQRRMRRWAPGWLAEAICIPLAAQLATQPLVTALSGGISVAGVACNALAGPFVGPVTVLGICIALLAPISPYLASLVGTVAGLASQPILIVAHTFAGLPAATWQWRLTPSSAVLLACLCLAAAIVLGWVLGRPWATALLLAALILACLRQPPRPGWPGDWQVAVCDVGQGDATVFRVADHQAVLVDTGPEPKAVLRCLAGLGVRELPLVVITHAHSDHVAALPTIVDRFGVSTVATSDVRGVQQVLGAGRTGVAVRELVGGSTLEVGALTWRTLGPLPSSAGVFTPAEGGENSAENDRSVVAVAVTGGLTVLVTGDVEPAGQDAIVASGAALGAQVLKLPHHGSARQSEAFFAATGAVVAIASAGERNEYGHPAPRTVRLAERLGMRVTNTADVGSIALSSSETGSVIVRTERPP